MEVSKKKPAAGVPAAKEPAPTLASGRYTFSKAEALRRYLARKNSRSGKGVSKAKRDEVIWNTFAKFYSYSPKIFSTEEEETYPCWETFQQRNKGCTNWKEEETQQLSLQEHVSKFLLVLDYQLTN